MMLKRCCASCTKTMMHSEVMASREDRKRKANPAQLEKYTRMLREAKSLSEARHVHSQIVTDGYGYDRLVGNLMIEAYGRFGSLEDARSVFNRLLKPNSYSWSAMLKACIQNGNVKQAQIVFDEVPDLDMTICNAMVVAYAKSKRSMEARSIFNMSPERSVVTWTALMSAYAQSGNVEEAKIIFERMPACSIQTWTVMVSAFAEDGQYEDAKRVFDEMKENDAYAWNTMITTFVRCCQLESAAEMFEKMPEHNVVAGTVLISEYAKNGLLVEAQDVFEKMPEADEIAWTAMITAYTQWGYCKEAVRMFKMMDLHGIRIDKFTFSIVLDACATLSSLAMGKMIHKNVLEDGITEVVVHNALLNMYGKCGALAESVKVFEQMPRRVIASWNSMIAAHTENGWGFEALNFFRLLHLDGMQPNEITFTGVLTACSHVGLLSEAWKYFLLMVGEFNVLPIPSHYICIIDLLGRAGRLGDGEELINTMPYYPESVAWLSLVGACRIHNDIDRGERAAEHVFEMDPECPSPYILLSHMYAQVGRMSDVKRIRRLMKERGIKNKRALSCVEIQHNILEFAVC